MRAHSYTSWLVISFRLSTRILLARYQIKMAKLDHAREQIAYSKFWLGVMVVTNISVIGWLISAPKGAEQRTVVLAILGVALLTIGIAYLHRRIQTRIDEIGAL